MPGTFFGPYNENFSDYAEPAGGNAGRFPLGHYLVLPDGRRFRFALNDGAVEVAGRLYQSIAPVSNHTDQNTDVARAVGDVAVSATLGATSAAQDIYSEGIVHVNDQDGEGYAFRIARAVANGQAHDAVAGSGVLTVNLDAGEQVQVALTASSSQLTFTRNRFHQILISPTTLTGSLAGVSPGVTTADRYYWSQVGGEAAVLVDKVLFTGQMVQASNNTAGAVESAKTNVRTGATAPGDSAALGANALDSSGSESAVTLINTVSNATYDISGPASIRGPLVGVAKVVNISGEAALIDLTFLD